MPSLFGLGLHSLFLLHGNENTTTPPCLARAVVQYGYTHPPPRGVVRQLGLFASAYLLIISLDFSRAPGVSCMRAGRVSSAEAALTHLTDTLAADKL